MIGNPAGAAELARRIGRQIESTKREDPTVMVEAAGITSLRQNGKNTDRTDARELAQAMII